jgi:hypothetical protein
MNWLESTPRGGAVGASFRRRLLHLPSAVALPVRFRATVAALFLSATFLGTGPIAAQESSTKDSPSEDEQARCVNDHREGQTLHRAGRLKASKERFQRCLDLQCSPVLRMDCAARLDEVEAEVPTIVLAARSSRGDLVEVSVFQSGLLLTSRLDGRPIALDPGPQALRFEAAGHEPLEERLLMRSGERNRLVLVTMKERLPSGSPSNGPALTSSPGLTSPTPGGTASEGSAAAPPRSVPAPPAQPLASFSTSDYFVFGTGLGLAAAGAVLGLVVVRERAAATEQCSPFCSEDHVDGIRRRGWIADGLLVLSAGTLLYGTIRWASRDAPSVALLIQPTSIASEVRF